MSTSFMRLVGAEEQARRAPEEGQKLLPKCLSKNNGNVTAAFCKLPEHRVTCPRSMNFQALSRGHMTLCLGSLGHAAVMLLLFFESHLGSSLKIIIIAKLWFSYYANVLTLFGKYWLAAM